MHSISAFILIKDNLSVVLKAKNNLAWFGVTWFGPRWTCVSSFILNCYFIFAFSESYVLLTLHSSSSIGSTFVLGETWCLSLLIHLFLHCHLNQGLGRRWGGLQPAAEAQAYRPSVQPGALKPSPWECTVSHKVRTSAGGYFSNSVLPNEERVAQDCWLIEPCCCFEQLEQQKNSNLCLPPADEGYCVIK